MDESGRSMHRVPTADRRVIGDKLNRGTRHDVVEVVQEAQRRNTARLGDRSCPV
jgi:hypothetical protein